MGCGNINKIRIPGTIKEIEDYAFEGCRKLDNVMNDLMLKIK